MGIVVSDDNQIECCGQNKKAACNLKDLHEDGFAIAQLYRRFDPSLIYLKNPTQVQLDEAFEKLKKRQQADSKALILFSFTGHALEDKGKLFAVTEGNQKSGLYPIEDKLVEFGKQNIVHAFLNCNRLYANYKE